MKKLTTILSLLILLIPLNSFSQDSVRITILKTSEKTIIYKIEGMRFVSYDCKCDTLKRGDIFWIPKKRFDSLLLEAKPVKRKNL